MFEIVEREEMAQGTIISNWIKAPKIAQKAKPGQFVILRANEKGERIPLTMADTDPAKGLINVIYMVVGKSTALFKTLKVGDSYLDVIGPLGQPTHLEKVGKVVCVGGGTGIAVLHPITRGLKQMGNYVYSIIGARSKDLLILEDKMRKVSDELCVTTDDGTYGHKGFVTDVLDKILSENRDIGLAVCIGPVPMMKFCAKMTKEYGVKTLVSLNPIMLDGTGMCGCCRVQVGGKMQFACVDGPEFDGHEVDFEELNLRLRSYLPEEKLAYDRFKAAMGHTCACKS
uniref:Sulfide/dihydroorotate dehydrogenase-like FAD/NAD-binding protein n=1 Tax=Desulfobacca acetoxidans TaxID=60893 RepID=A0A7C3ZC05_9BACT